MSQPVPSPDTPSRLRETLAVPVTIETIGRAAGLSASTVSRALRNQTCISQATRDRVRAAAERLGYRPNPYLTTLMAHVRLTHAAPYSATLIWLDRSVQPEAWRTNYVQRGFYGGAATRAEALGFRIERLAYHDSGLTPKRLSEVLEARGIYGVLCSSDHPELGTEEIPLDVRRFAIATVGYRSISPGLHFSTNDQFVSSRRGHRELRRLGYRRVGYVTSHDLEMIVEYRFLGGFLSLAVPSPQPGVLFLDESGAVGARRWMHEFRPDAVLLSPRVDPRALVASLGVRIPEDLGIALLDWQEGLPEYAGVAQNHERVGAGAVDLVAGQISRNEYGPPLHATGILYEGDWRDGPSAPRRSDEPG